MITVEALKPEHLEGFEPQERHIVELPFDWREKTLAAQGLAGAFIADGMVVALGGLEPCGRQSFAWTTLREGSAGYLFGLTKAFKWFLQGQGEVLSAGRADWPAAKRWLTMLGFSRCQVQDLENYELYEGSF